MAKKKAVLPKEMKEFLEIGDISRLKDIFSECEPNALRSKKLRRDSNVFSFTPLSREFAEWVKEQGADVNFQDEYGFTPIFYHAGDPHGDVQLLIDLGAETNILMFDGTTPLHEAAVYGQLNAVKALLKAGIDINAGKGMTWGTPLESVVRQNCIPCDKMLEMCQFLLEQGADMNEQAQNSMLITGMRIQKAWKRKKLTEGLEEQTQALQQLCQLFDVDLTCKADVKDNVPYLNLRDLFKKNHNSVEAFYKLWDYFVPASGKCQTAQGEVIRIIGRIRREVMVNGGANWDDDFRKMLHTIPDYLCLGNARGKDRLEFLQCSIEELAKTGEEERPMHHILCECVYWVRENGRFIEPLPANYKR